MSLPTIADAVESRTVSLNGSIWLAENLNWYWTVQWQQRTCDADVSH